MSMTKSDIVERIHDEVGISKKESAEMVDIVFKIIKDTLARGEKVKISGFGNFVIRDKNSRTGRNPQTGDSLEIAARRVITFRPSEVLKEDITERFLHRIDENGKEDKTVPPKDSRSRSLTSYTDQEHDIQQKKGA